MKKALLAMAAALLLSGCTDLDPKVSLQPPPNIPKQMVGGVCDYDQYLGECKFTGVSGSAAVFQYKGPVDGKAVVLAANKVEGRVAGGAKEGDTFACKLNFIVNGTCTPCLITSLIFTAGECGPDAWDLFRKR